MNLLEEGILSLQCHIGLPALGWGEIGNVGGGA